MSSAAELLELFDDAESTPVRAFDLESSSAEPADFNGELFEEIDRVVTAPAVAAELFNAMMAGIAFMNPNQVVEQIFYAYDDLLSRGSLSERDIQKGLLDALPQLYWQVLAYGLRPNLQENYDPDI